MRRQREWLLLSLGALGVVFGDIGTSPLYALREALNPAHGVPLTRETILGVLSLITWSLLAIVTVKYLVFVLRADNGGEGGILALMALVHPKEGSRARAGAIIVLLGLFGAALLYGDGVITPAISMLSAMEGLDVISPAFHGAIIPLTLAILVGLFALQRTGTATIGKLFGPVTLVWFVVLAALGIRGILLDPTILAALDPRHGVWFLAHEGIVGLFVLGSVFLVVTGAEALYADMGHFGKGPIRATWLALVLPSLLLNYFGQGALLMSRPDALANPFYLLAPAWAIVPLVVLATLATIIASQAIISGAFSLTMQAVSLGYLPRVDIQHTSDRQFGQIYVPSVNWALTVGTLYLVVTFRTSSALASAYGIAVTATMVITSLLLYAVATQRWGWSRAVAGTLVGAFLAVELAFLVANGLKLLSGGWVPLAIAGAILFLMTTWRRGREVLRARLRERSLPVGRFLDEVAHRGYTRVRGNAVYMTGNAALAPPAMVKNLEHNRILHMQTILLTIQTEETPYVDRTSRVHVEAVRPGVYRVVARYGFMDEPDAMDVLRLLGERGILLQIHDTTFFVGREHLIARAQGGLARWREVLFGFLTRNAQEATNYFRIPPDRVVEVGSQVEI